MIKVSVIVPVYNVEKEIAECLNSLAHQTFSDYEVLVINDSSPDNSQKIIDKYTKKYKFIKSFIKPNGGLSDARNFGLAKAKGEYILFVDGDDFVRNDMLLKLYNNAQSNNSDIVLCNFYEYYDKDNQKEVSCINQIKTKNITDKYLISPPAAWNKLFKKELFTDNNINFPKGLWYEDFATILKFYKITNNISIVNDPLYYYRQRDNSIMHSISPKIFDMYKTAEIVSNYFNENLNNNYNEAISYIVSMNLFGIIIKLAKSNYENKYYHQCETLDIINKLQPGWKNSYIYKNVSPLQKITIFFISNKFLLRVYNAIRKII